MMFDNAGRGGRPSVRKVELDPKSLPFKVLVTGADDAGAMRVTREAPGVGAVAKDEEEEAVKEEYVPNFGLTFDRRVEHWPRGLQLSLLVIHGSILTDCCV